MRKREDAQEGRRRLFLQNVRQKQEDQKWVRRGGENELLKLEWQRLNREFKQAKESDIEGFIRIEDFENEPYVDEQAEDGMEDIDSMMVDALEQEEQAQIEALAALHSGESQTSQSRPESMHFSDEDYDDLFMELLSAQEQNKQTSSHQDVEML